MKFFFATNAAPDTPPPVAAIVLSIEETDTLVTAFIFVIDTYPDTQPQVARMTFSVEGADSVVLSFFSTTDAAPDTSPAVAGVVLSVVGAEATITVIAVASPYTLFATEGYGDTNSVNNKLVCKHCQP